MPIYCYYPLLYIKQANYAIFNDYMKKLLFVLMVALMSVMASTPGIAKIAEGNVMMNVIPANLIVKQTTQFNDGRTLVIYFKKQGMDCELYSPCNANDYSVDDASMIKSANFEMVDKVEGKLYKKATLGEVTQFIKQMVDLYF